LPRSTLVFTVSAPQIQSDLLHEFSLHADVVATADQIDGRPALIVQTNGSAGAMWDVRATVGMYDDHAAELTDQG